MQHRVRHPATPLQLRILGEQLAQRIGLIFKDPALHTAPQCRYSKYQPTPLRVSEQRTFKHRPVMK
jgi:hypothetical protein